MSTILNEKPDDNNELRKQWESQWRDRKKQLLPDSSIPFSQRDFCGICDGIESMNMSKENTNYRNWMDFVETTIK